MRNARLTLTVYAVALAGTAAVGAGAHSYRAISLRSHELERQNASLRSGYDELRSFAIECLVREEEGLLATVAGTAASSREATFQGTSDARHRAHDAAHMDTVSPEVPMGTRGRETHSPGASVSRPRR